MMNNVDPIEVEKFDELAMDWWDQTGPCKPLHDLNPLRLSFIQSNSMITNKHILDIGCGGGILSEALSFYSPQVIGIDQSRKALEVAKNHAASLKNPPQYLPATAEDFAKEHPGRFDIITCMELLEHVPSPSSILNACHHLLKAEGDLFVSTLNRTVKAFLLAIVGAEYILNILPKGTHDYGRFIRPSELAKWAQYEGFHVKHLRGIRYHPFTKRYTLAEDVSVHYLMHLQKGEQYDQN